MTLTDRVNFMQEYFELIQQAQGRNEKEYLVSLIPSELKDDFNFCLEVLAGKHKLGYKYETVKGQTNVAIEYRYETIRSIIYLLETPKRNGDLSRDNVFRYLAATYSWSDFLEPLCNRTFRLGIGSSLLEKEDTFPMLAKKFEGNMLPFDISGWTITEKLDGNRCIAFYDNDQWNFISRNGKFMNVEFDMSGLPTDFVYDGEVISPSQYEQSIYIANHIYESIDKLYNINKSDFNSTSGLINRKTKAKNLVYCIFDIQADVKYTNRRTMLNHLEPIGKDVRILPALCVVKQGQEEFVGELLDKVVTIGGEGLMLNKGSALYNHKRTNDLLKYKQVQTMDMIVADTLPGTGKYEGLVGSLECIAKDNFTDVKCSVGSGLSDKQRFEWRDKNKIVGKVVEISYFSLSQEKALKGTDEYSLRFPRLKKVREDKNSTSIY